MISHYLEESIQQANATSLVDDLGVRMVLYNLGNTAEKATYIKVGYTAKLGNVFVQIVVANFNIEGDTLKVSEEHTAVTEVFTFSKKTLETYFDTNINLLTLANIIDLYLNILYGEVIVKYQALLNFPNIKSIDTN